jgi:hypothetical protein
VAAGPVTQAAPVDLTNPAEVFKAAHRLTAVLFTERGRHAVVDGKMIMPGQSIDGFTLISVTHDTAVFRSGAVTAVLRTEMKVQ